MPAMSRITGKPLSSPLERLRQSIEDILTTPIGSRVGRRDYGSRLPELVDVPLTPPTIVDVIAETAEPIARQEPDFIVRRVVPKRVGLGGLMLDIAGDYEGQGVVFEGIVI